jgi:hypothetical protein
VRQPAPRLSRHSPVPHVRSPPLFGPLFNECWGSELRLESCPDLNCWQWWNELRCRRDRWATAGSSSDILRRCCGRCASNELRGDFRLSRWFRRSWAEFAASFGALSIGSRPSRSRRRGRGRIGIWAKLSAIESVDSHAQNPRRIELAGTINFNTAVECRHGSSFETSGGKVVNASEIT